MCVVLFWVNVEFNGGVKIENVKVNMVISVKWFEE